MKEILKEIDDIVEYTKSQLNEYVLPDDDIIFFIRDGFWKTAALLKSYHCNNENKTVYERMKEERDEVKERLDKLNRLLDKVFIEGTVFISETQAHYLKEQRDYMQGYLDTLDKRLEDFARAEELKDFKEYEGRNMHFAEQIKLLKELHKEANIQGALMSAGDIERGLLHLIKENKNLCKDKVEEYLKNLERE